MEMILKIKKTFLLILVAYSTLGFSQDTSSFYTIFDTAKVHAVYSNRSTLNSNTIGSNIQIITQKDIKLLPVQTTAELLSYLLGVDLRQRGPMGIQSDIQIQGSTFDQVLILIDGVKMSDPQTGHHQMNLSISPEAIERIEVLKGSAARRYGLNALAGVVNIITKLPNNSSSVVQIHAGTSGQQSSQNKLYSNQGYRLYTGIASHSVKAWLDANV
ncbi:MAG: TonB-dependent receptor plug domain-containing protein, partial [Bacteroidia bacterium]|nr:TonB-dependent receptor plug domain-containing protein [Bacteroidia bacterium]